MTLAQSIIIYLVSPVLGVIFWLIIAEVVFSWLVAFNVINLRNPMVAQIYGVIRTVTEPILRPIRNVLPSMGGLDFSPIVAILAIQWIRGFVLPGLLPMLGSG